MWYLTRDTWHLTRGMWYGGGKSFFVSLGKGTGRAHRDWPGFGVTAAEHPCAHAHLPAVLRIPLLYGRRHQPCRQRSTRAQALQMPPAHSPTSLPPLTVLLPAVQVVTTYSAEFNADEVFANERSAVIAHLPSMDDAPRGAGAGGAGGVGFFETATAGAAKTDLAAMELDAEEEEEEEGSEEGDDGEEGGDAAGVGFSRLHPGTLVKLSWRIGSGPSARVC